MVGLGRTCWEMLESEGQRSGTRAPHAYRTNSNKIPCSTAHMSVPSGQCFVPTITPRSAIRASPRLGGSSGHSLLGLSLALSSTPISFADCLLYPFTVMSHGDKGISGSPSDELLSLRLSTGTPDAVEMWDLPHSGEETPGTWGAVSGFELLPPMPSASSISPSWLGPGCLHGPR